MNKLQFLLFSLAVVACCPLAPENRPLTSDDTTAGPVVIRDSERHFIDSKIIGEQFEIDVFLPKGYHEGDSRYPVLYVCDAEYNFGAVAYITRRLIKNNEIPPIILVGIAYNTDYGTFYDRRSRDMTPTDMGDRSPEGWETGKADRFASFIEQELVPWVNSNFRTDPEDRGLCGHSYGGLFASYVLLTRNHLFSRYLIASPSYWYDGGIIFSYEESYAEKHDNLEARAYLSVGARERSHMVTNLQKMERLLRSRNYSDLALQTSIIAEETHRSVFPFSFTKGLRFLYAD